MFYIVSIILAVGLSVVYSKNNKLPYLGNLKFHWFFSVLIVPIMSAAHLANGIYDLFNGRLVGVVFQW